MRLCVQPYPYFLVSLGWERTARSLITRAGGKGVGRLQAGTALIGALASLNKLHKAGMVHGRVSPTTVVEAEPGGCWTVVEFHSVAPIGADWLDREQGEVWTPPPLTPTLVLFSVWFYQSGERFSGD